MQETAAAGLLGTVRGPDGVPLGGIAVYAKGVDGTITTTVFTDPGGDYVFPALAPGAYRLWAQAVGFETSRAAVALQAARRTAQAFTLQAIADPAPQLSAAEWMAALPVRTKAQRRMKEILRVNCAMCHSIASILQHRYDEPGWLAMVDQMARYNRAPRRPTVEFTRRSWRAIWRPCAGPIRRRWRSRSCRGRPATPRGSCSRSTTSRSRAGRTGWWCSTAATGRRAGRPTAAT